MNPRFFLIALLLTPSLAFAEGKPKSQAKPGAPTIDAPAAAPQAPAPAIPNVPPPPAPPAANEMPEEIIARFFTYLQRREVDVAYDQLTKGTKIAERAEDVKTLKSKTKDAISVFGVMRGHEVVTKKNVGERLTSYTCVSLGEEFPLRWRFYFYKPNDHWKLIDLRVDDRLAAIFDEPEDPRVHETQAP